MFEPKRITLDIKKLATKIRSDPEFSSLVFDMRDLMSTHGAAPNKMRAALRFVLHEEAWRRYRREIVNGPTAPVEITDSPPEHEDESYPNIGPFFTNDDDGPTEA